MIPILYGSDEVLYTSEGLGRLPGATSCQVTYEPEAMRYELELEIPWDKDDPERLKLRQQILALPFLAEPPQPFEIYRITLDGLGNQVIYARHIANRLSGIPAAPFTAGTAREAMENIRTLDGSDPGFTFAWEHPASGEDVYGDLEIDKPVSIWDVLETIRDTYGGTIWFDRRQVTLRIFPGGTDRTEPGIALCDGDGAGLLTEDGYCLMIQEPITYRGGYAAENGAAVAYGANMTDLRRSRDGTDRYTRVLCYYQTEDAAGNLLRYWGQTPETNDPRQRTLILDKTREAAAYAAENGVEISDQVLETLAWDYLLGHPEMLEDTVTNASSYADGETPQPIRPMDSVAVWHPEAGTTVEQAVKTTWDVLREKYVSVDLGEVQRTLADELADIGRASGVYGRDGSSGEDGSDGADAYGAAAPRYVLPLGMLMEYTKIGSQDRVWRGGWSLGADQSRAVLAALRTGGLTVQGTLNSYGDFSADSESYRDLSADSVDRSASYEILFSRQEKRFVYKIPGVKTYLGDHGDSDTLTVWAEVLETVCTLDAAGTLKAEVTLTTGLAQEDYILWTGPLSAYEDMGSYDRRTIYFVYQDEEDGT